MRRWIARLHGGQLIMLLVFVGVAGALPFFIGKGLMDDASADFAVSAKYSYGVMSEGIRQDSVASRLFFENGAHKSSIGWRFALVGLGFWLLTIPMLWIWFGARRRNAIVAEVISE